MVVESSSGSRFLTTTLLMSCVVLAYYYYDAATIASTLNRDATSLREKHRNDNATASNMRVDLEKCQAELKIASEERNKADGAFQAKEKELGDQVNAEKGVQDQLNKLKAEKEDFEKKTKETQASIDALTKSCDDQVKAAKESCKQVAANPEVTTPAPAVSVKAA